MSLEALKKVASSSKVLLFLIFVVGITVALKLKLVDALWYQSVVANAFYVLMGGYSAVEAARAVFQGKTKIADVLEDPKAALDKATVEVVMVDEEKKP